VLDGVCMVWIVYFMKLLEAIGRLSRLALEITLGGSDVFLVRAVHFLIIIVIIAGSNCDPLGRHFCPFLLSLALLIVPLLAALGGAPQLPPGSVFPLSWMKTAPATFSPEACRVAMSSSSFIVFG
jgi:hypothetical protein